MNKTKIMKTITLIFFTIIYSSTLSFSQKNLLEQTSKIANLTPKVLIIKTETKPFKTPDFTFSIPFRFVCICYIIEPKKEEVWKKNSQSRIEDLLRYF